MSHTNTRLAEPNEVAGMFAKAPNVESLFEINYDAATETLWVNDCTACYTWPSGTWFAMWPSAELLALFAPGDARLALYPTTPAGVRYSNKYTYARGSWTDNTPVIRYADVLLMRAEAYAENGQDALGLADLNALRAKRGAAALTVTGAALKSAIQDERRRELAFEGSRWFDLKRARPEHHEAGVRQQSDRGLHGLQDPGTRASYAGGEQCNAQTEPRLLSERRIA